jgi:hypothetical protein
VRNKTFQNKGVKLKSENVIIGEAMLELLRTHPREKFSRKLLEQYLLNLYVQKYEASTSINEIELYLSALKSVRFRRQ